jgi:hypothetical protein
MVEYQFNGMPTLLLDEASLRVDGDDLVIELWVEDIGPVHRSLPAETVAEWLWAVGGFRVPDDAP